MINQAIRFVTGVLVGFGIMVGCGAAPEEQDLGQTGEAITAPRTATFVLGSTNSSAALRCTTSNASQVCNVPSTRVYAYCAVGLNSEELLDLPTVANAGTNFNGHFSATELRDGSGNVVRDAACTTAFNAGTANILVNHIDNFCSPAGGSATNIDSFVCAGVTPSGAQLSEVPGVPGSFFPIRGGVIHIDRARLQFAFPNATDRARVRQHGLGHSMVAIEGLGARTDSTTTFLWSRRQVLPISTVGRTLSPGEDCTLSFYSSTGATTYAQDATDCVSGD